MAEDGYSVNLNVQGVAVKFPEWYDLKGDRSKDMSVRVSTCTSYDVKELTPIVRKLWRW